jgi:hypothetical protein
MPVGVPPNKTKDHVATFFHIGVSARGHDLAHTSCACRVCVCVCVRVCVCVILFLVRRTGDTVLLHADAGGADACGVGGAAGRAATPTFRHTRRAWSRGRWRTSPGHSCKAAAWGRV